VIKEICCLEFGDRPLELDSDINRDGSQKVISYGKSVPLPENSIGKRVLLLVIK
jgi:hypothetical protein